MTVEGAAAAPGGTGSEPTPDRAAQIVKAVSGIASALALLTALLYYFGWVRSESQARAFGADASLFGMSSPELVIRSADVLFVPLLIIVLGGVFVLWAHRRLIHGARNHPGRARVRIIVRSLRVVAVIAFLVAGCLLVALPTTSGPVALPFLFAAGFGSAWYAHELGQRVAAEPTVTPTPLFLALAAVIAISLFWMAERVARIGGEARVEAIKADIGHYLGGVTIYAAERLEIAGRGLRVEVLGDASKPVYRYTGAYLLQRSGGAYFFLSDGWTTEMGRLIVVPEGKIIRLDFGPER